MEKGLEMEKIKQHCLYLDDLLGTKESTRLYTMNLDLNGLSDCIFGEEKKTLMIYKYAFYLFRLMTFSLWDKSKLGFNCEGLLGVWVDHPAFLETIKHMDVSQRGLRKDLKFLTERRLISSEARHNNYRRMQYYFITKKALKFFRKDIIEEYKKVIVKTLSERYSAVGGEAF